MLGECCGISFPLHDECTFHCRKALPNSFRIPFLLSLVLVAISLYIRLKIMETPQFTKVVASQETASAPLMQVIRRFPREIILSALLRMSEQMPF